MSTLGIIEALLDVGTLSRFEPSRVLPWEAIRRQVVMTTELAEELRAKPRKRADRDRLAATRTHVGRFVLGEKIENEGYMWELEGPQGIFELKIRKFIIKDQVRVFGVFASPDCFFATHMRSRNWMDREPAR